MKKILGWLFLFISLPLGIILGIIFAFSIPVSAATYATFDPINKASCITLSNGNLTAQGVCGGSWQSFLGNTSKTSGKWYWEINLEIFDNSANQILTGVGNISTNLSSYLGSDSNSMGYLQGGLVFPGGTSYGNTYSQGNILSVLMDLDNGTIEYYLDGVSQGTAFNSISGNFFPALSYLGGSNIKVTANFGQSAFIYTVPTGFEAGLCAESSCGGGVVTPPIDQIFNQDFDSFLNKYHNLITLSFSTLILSGIILAFLNYIRDIRKKI